jgi:hypothetical protein
MLAAPEFVEAERVDLLDEIEVAAGTAASDARRSDDAGRGRLRISGVPWGFSPAVIVFGWLPQTTWPETPRQSRKNSFRRPREGGDP